MAEYIERELLFKKVLEEKRFVFQTEDLLNSAMVIETVYSDFGEFVNSIPAADVVEVVHGEWVDNVDESGKLCNVWRKCSSCGCLNYSTKPNYCPNCGARMDGERKD